MKLNFFINNLKLKEKNQDKNSMIFNELLKNGTYM